MKAFWSAFDGAIGGDAWWKIVDPEGRLMSRCWMAFVGDLATLSCERKMKAVAAGRQAAGWISDMLGLPPPAPPLKKATPAKPAPAPPTEANPYPEGMDVFGS